MTTPWWHARLPELRAMLTRFARRHLGAEDTEDVVQESLTAVVANMRAHPERFPDDWLRETPDDEGAARGALERYARGVLRKRVADRYRRQAVAWRYHDDLAADAAESGPAKPDDALLQRELVAATVSAFAAMSDEDAELMRLAVEGYGLERPMTAVERKRLSRARQKLAERILATMREEYGVDAAHLFLEEYLL